ncbi:alpha/beta fold hydrolase [Arthrobacter sp. ISL-30]|uniref:alpha/beta fold hydrolase n=1 Tax=Arthrobacter sp. ISL-30 TaxID=2819109 RepID=UPI001BEA9CEE|nr:alpha/beta hydrolase [Arthrobacter sp. ISL-30]MBT2514565.1 alpha/beta hydrolase [Arthrobacter sp. ISL-30]
MFTVISADGTEVQAQACGAGPTILILPPGMDDGAGYRKVAGALAERHRVIVLHRRQYRLDLPAGCSFADEVADVKAVVDLLGEKVLIFGHSSGGYLASECLAAMPWAFHAGAIYEPPVPLHRLVGGEFLPSAQRAVAAGRPGRAMQIFTRDMVELPAWHARLIGVFVSLVPKMRKMAARQIADVAAMDALGFRLSNFDRVSAPVLLIGGDRSPGHLNARLDALRNVLQKSEQVVLRGQGHSAQMRAPQELAALITEFYARITAGVPQQRKFHD